MCNFDISDPHYLIFLAPRLLHVKHLYLQRVLLPILTLVQREHALLISLASLRFVLLAGNFHYDLGPY